MTYLRTPKLEPLLDDTYCHRGMDDYEPFTKPIKPTRNPNMLALKIAIFVLILVVFANIAQFSEYMVHQAQGSCPEALVECD